MAKLNEQSETTYPAQYETQVLLKDGSSIMLRPINVDDARSWVEFVDRLDERTKYLRFHYQAKGMGLEDAVRFCTVDYRNTFAFVAEVLRETKRDIVAIGRYYRLPDGHSAEVALALEGSYQGRGLGTSILERLAEVARENGIDIFEADVLAENEQMMNVFKDYGFHVTSELQTGVGSCRWGGRCGSRSCDNCGCSGGWSLG